MRGMNKIASLLVLCFSVTITACSPPPEENVESTQSALIQNFPPMTWTNNPDCSFTLCRSVAPRAHEVYFYLGFNYTGDCYQLSFHDGDGMGQLCMTQTLGQLDTATTWIHSIKGGLAGFPPYSYVSISDCPLNIYGNPDPACAKVILTRFNYLFPALTFHPTGLVGYDDY